jgi:hypothetical protein
MKVGVSGHQKIPRGALQYIKEEIRQTLQRFGSGKLIGLSSLAAGADQLFASIILDVGGRLEVVVPSHNYESSFASQDDRAQYLKLSKQAGKVETLPYPFPSEDAYLAAGMHIVDQCDLLIAVWDGLPARGKGGTADIVDYAKGRGRRTRVIWPSGAAR